MQFEPLSDDDMDKMNPQFQPGLTTFKVIEATEKVSKQGNPMIEMTLQCKDASGIKRRMYDRIMALPKMMWKLKHFCEAAGMPEKYESKNISADDCVEKTGVCMTQNQKQEDGTLKIVVKDYIEMDPDHMPKEFNDEIPF